MDDAARICARLVREGTVPREGIPALDHPEVRSDVERRLKEIGLVLATSAYSDHVGLRLSEEVISHTDFDAASNLGLRSDACALLVILWSRLVLQKRTASETREVPGQGQILPEDKADAARRFMPQYHLSAIVREFGKIIGSRTHIKSLVTTLRRLRFLAGHGDIILSGPLLELAIDGEKMIAFIKREVLTGLLEREKPGEERELEDSVEAQVHRVLKELGGRAGMTQLSAATHERPGRLRDILKDLIDQGRVRREGERNRTIYITVS
jgi:hypothetical protein